MEYINTSQAAEKVLNRVPYNDFDVGIILGSGLSGLDRLVENETVVPYDEIEELPETDVEGHGDKLVVGELGGKTVAILTGRTHYYEGFSISEVALPSLVLSDLGVETLIVTNAAGAVNPEYNPGNLMVMEDHINMMGDNPLSYYNPKKGEDKFVDMSEAYSEELQQTAQSVLESETSLDIQNGVYLANKGPTYETPAEVNMAYNMGADVVGMSTVPEVIMARQKGLQVLGISCITNMGAGLQKEQLSHEEVTETAEMVNEELVDSMVKIINRI